MSRLELAAPSRFDKIWDDSSTGSRGGNLTLLRPVPPFGFYILGDFAERGHNPAVLPESHPCYRLLAKDRAICVVVREIESSNGPPLLAPPVAYKELWNDKGSGGKFGDVSIWVIPFLSLIFVEYRSQGSERRLFLF